MATPTPERSDGPRGAVNAAARRSARPWPEPSSTALIARMAATLIPVLQFWTLALWRRPRPVPGPTPRVLQGPPRGLGLGSRGPHRRSANPRPTPRRAPHPRGDRTEHRDADQES